jgi:predicted AlkP superfamily pyrophosphatase or phosphodiesterase
MLNFRIILLLYFICLLSIIGSIRAGQIKNSEKPLLLLIALDGFRIDYIEKYDLKNFAYIKSIGAYAKNQVYSVFPSMTFPNLYTMITGHFPENHGIIDNYIYDVELNKKFVYKIPESETLEWYAQNKLLEPIWITNQKLGNGRRSAAEWPSSSLNFNNQTIIRVEADHKTSYFELINRFIIFFKDEKDPINFGALYLSNKLIILHFLL